MKIQQYLTDAAAATIRRTQTQQNVWQYLRQRFLSNRVFDSYDAILKAICEAWNKIIEEPDRITSIGSRQWAAG